jgi:ABC-type transport system substrate-binding protein
MSIDRTAIKEAYYQGEAEILAHPTPPPSATVTFADAYIPVEGLSEAVQQQFTYDPQKAKQMLASAGYPDGFKAKVITEAKDTDLLQVIQGYFRDVGVDLEIQVKERAVFLSIVRAKTQEEMVMASIYSGGATWYAGFPFSNSHYSNYARWLDPVAMEIYDELFASQWEFKKTVAVYEKYTNTILETGSWVVPPVPYQYAVWQPWVKDYSGEGRTSYGAAFDFATYLWIDQDLKEEMTGVR